MNNLVVREQKDKITSLELVEQINIFREQEGNRKELQHKTLLEIIRDEFEEEIREQKILPSFYKRETGNNTIREYPMFELTLNQAKQVLMRESKFVRKAVIHYIEELEHLLKTTLTDKDKLLLGLFSQDPSVVASSHKALVELEKKPLLEKIEEDKPKVEYHDKVLNTETCYTTTQIAKELEMSAIQLNVLLSNMGVQFKQSGQWMLTAKYQDKGYVKTRTYLFKGKDGKEQTKHNTCWTEKGRQFLLELSETF